MKATPHTPRKTEGANPPGSVRIERTFILTLPNGLHGRPCALLVKRLRALDCQVTVECGGAIARTSSILEMLSLGARCQSTLKFGFQGADSAAALAAVELLFATHFEEAYSPATPPPHPAAPRASADPSGTRGAVEGPPAV